MGRGGGVLVAGGRGADLLRGPIYQPSPSQLFAALHKATSYRLIGYAAHRTKLQAKSAGRPAMRPTAQSAKSTPGWLSCTNYRYHRQDTGLPQWLSDGELQQRPPNRQAAAQAPRRTRQADAAAPQRTRQEGSERVASRICRKAVQSGDAPACKNRGDHEWRKVLKRHFWRSNQTLRCVLRRSEAVFVRPNVLANRRCAPRTSNEATGD